MTERTRTITWQDPMIGFEAAKSLTGLAYLQAMINGELPRPPISHLMDFVLSEVGDGWAVFTGNPSEFHYNPIGVVHGGLSATLIDSATGCAVQTKLPAGVGYTTIELHVNYVRPLTITTGTVRCKAEVIHIGRTIGTAEARIVDVAGKLYAHGTATCMIFQPEKG